MQIIADLQIHSRFSRAVSKDMTIPNIAAWAVRKGIGLVATGDWTHPMWFREIEKDLEEVGNGLLKLKDAGSLKMEAGLKNSNLQHPTSNFPLFMLATEVSSIFTQNGKGRRVHTLIWVPTIDSARKISQEMTKRGCNLMSDGRPIIPLSCIQVAELVFSIEPKALVFPAHAWTPWFSTFGSMSGFNSISEAFGEYADRIYAVETGLSSNPSMNWQIGELDHRTIVSFSDAHSGPKLGREATVFEIPEGKLSYDAVYEAIKRGFGSASVTNENLDVSPVSLPSATLRASTEMRVYPEPVEGQSGATQNFVRSPQTDKPSIAYTIEFYPEEGKYHFTGHRACNIRYGSDETKTKGVTCPVCGKPLTQGVVQRVEELSNRSETDLKLEAVNLQLNENGPEIKMTKSLAFPNRPPFVMLVPLQEIISEAIGSPVTSKKTQFHYQNLTDKLGSEFNVLLHTRKEQIAEFSNPEIAEGVEKVRTGDITIDPGYDGVFGVVKIWKSEKDKALVDKSKEQLSMFSEINPEIK